MYSQYLYELDSSASKQICRKILFSPFSTTNLKNRKHNSSSQATGIDVHHNIIYYISTKMKYIGDIYAAAPNNASLLSFNSERTPGLHSRHCLITRKTQPGRPRAREHRHRRPRASTSGRECQCRRAHVDPRTRASNRTPGPSGLDQRDPPVPRAAARRRDERAGGYPGVGAGGLLRH